KREKFPTRGRGSENKVPVVTLVERNGEARSKVTRHVTGVNIKQMLLKEVDTNASIMTDTLNVYKTATAQDFPLHETVDHQSGEYARGAVHTNSVENYFSQLKRSIDGTHHHVSEQHLDRYLAEFDFRYSTRKIEDAERTEKTIRRAAGKRLTYKDLTAEVEP